jgi:hypothetical protein
MTAVINVLQCSFYALRANDFLPGLQYYFPNVLILSRLQIDTAHRSTYFYHRKAKANINPFRSPEPSSQKLKIFSANSSKPALPNTNQNISRLYLPMNPLVLFV